MSDVTPDPAAPVQTPTSRHRTFVVSLRDGFAGRCHECVWDGGWAYTVAAARADGREHGRVRAEKAIVHPWLDVK